MQSPIIGVLALQGDVREHVQALREVGAAAIPVRRAAELERVQGLVIPGGESTVIDRLLRTFELFDPVRARIGAGMPTYGSCAGMILLADRVQDAGPSQRALGGLDVTVRRNAFGRQVASFETDLAVTGITAPQDPMRAVFIRAPWVETAGESVDVLASVRVVATGSGGADAHDRPVVVRQGHLLASSFHPEVTGDVRMHAYFTQMVRDARP